MKSQSHEQARLRSTSHDAVIVVPGIMGSELWDTRTRTVVWGLDPSWYLRAWCTPGGLKNLEMTHDEREGRYGRIRATRLLRFTAFSPILHGLEPYTKLVNSLRAISLHPDAVAEFPYDWRLSVETSTPALADLVDRHIEAWQRHPAYVDNRKNFPNSRPAQVVLVAHSMGGLLCRSLTLIPGALDHVRAIITIGTPFDGAAKVAIMMNTGRGSPVPLPRRTLRRVAITLPGLYDLLPSYRCIDMRESVERLSPTSIQDLGGDWDLAAAAFHRQEMWNATTIPKHRVIVGSDQPTIQSLSISGGIATPHKHSFLVEADGGIARTADGQLHRVDRMGDGTVPRNSAIPTNSLTISHPVQHGHLQSSDSIIADIRSILLDYDADRGPRLSEGETGMEVPDIVVAGRAWQASITGDVSPASRCLVSDVETSLPIDSPKLSDADGGASAAITLPHPGIFRVSIHGGGSSPVSQLVMATDSSQFDPA